MSGEALFVPETASTYHPTELCRGPWRADAQHGGPPSALLGRLSIAEVDDDEFLAAIEVELIRPAPLAPLAGAVEVEQVSGRVRRLHATLRVGDEVVARSNALVLRSSELDPPEWQPDPAVAVGPPDETRRALPPKWATGHLTAYHRDAVEHRFERGSFATPGPAVDWLRLRQPVVAGERPSGVERCLAAADIGSGISAVYGPDAPTGLINANLAVSFIRPLEGEWVSLDATTHVGSQGTGLAVTVLGDASGTVGHATQSLLGYRLRFS